VPDLASRSALHDIAAAGRFGRPGGEPGLLVRERVDLGLATVMARRGRGAELAEAVRAAYGATLADRPTISGGEAVSFVGAGPGHWLAISEALANGALADDLQARLAGLASVSDQSDARGVLRLAGPKAREVLAKGLPIDLHPRVFRPGDAVTSTISHIGVQLWQVDDAPTYDVAFFRSYSGSFWKWLTDSAGEFGYRYETLRG
jgi:sarcosine oxidase subunit gamma